MDFIPYGRHSICEEDIEAVLRALRSDFLTCGPEVEAFEREFAAFVGAKHAVAVSSATAALHLAMRVLNLGPGDRVVTSPITFVASANAAAYVGAVPDFCDIQLETGNLDPVALESGWKSDTRAVVAVDYAGVPCDMPEIARVARERGAFVIEDACHGTGGGFRTENGKWKLGGHPWADITTFSFHPVKTLTTGEGGILLTDNEEWAAKARLLRSHGITRNSEDFFGLLEPARVNDADERSPFKEQGDWYYEMQALGYNYRITDLQCALGRSQLRRLPEFKTRRQEIARRYTEAFSRVPWMTLPQLTARAPGKIHGRFAYDLTDLSLHLYTVRIDFQKIGKSRSQVIRELRAKGIGSQVLYIPVYLQPWYRKTYGYALGKCPAAEAFYSGALSLPLHAGIRDNEAEKIIGEIVSLASQ
jgi:perosamine synthetase